MPKIVPTLWPNVMPNINGAIAIFRPFFAKIMVYVIIESQPLRLMFLNYKIASSSMFLLPNKIYVVIVIRYSIMYGPFCVTYGLVLLKWYSYKSIYSLVIFMLGQIFQNEILKSLIFSEYYKIIIFSSSEFGSKYE